MIKGILFDFNGTMVFDGPKHKEAWNEFSIQYRKCPILDSELDQMHGQTNKKIIEMLLGNGLSEKEIEDLSLRKEALYRECCLKDPTYGFVEGLEDLLNKCKERKIPMTICSASIKENIEFFINFFNLKKWFHVEDIIYDDGTHTNKISMFHDGANALHVPIEDCLVIEDSYSGIKYAHACNVNKIIAITSIDKHAEFKQLPGVTATITDYKGLNLDDLLK